MNLAIADHVLALFLVVLLPLYGVREWQGLLAAIAAGRERARVAAYRQTMALEWGLVLLLLIAWLAAGRPLALLGIALPGGRQLLWGASTTAAVLAVLWWQWRSVQAQAPEALVSLRRQLESVAPLMPRTPREHRQFRGLALTAGTTEELLYRGFLIWYFAALLGHWPGVVMAVVAFALGHAYQGAMGVLKTGMVGAILTAIYLASGSLLWPVLLHCAIDLQGGAFARVAGLGDYPSACQPPSGASSPPL